MKAVVQRVSSASVLVGGRVVGAIDHGVLALVGAVEGDEERDLEWMARKISGLRIFADDDGKMNRSVADIGGKVLLVSQFTVCADVSKGTRPSFGRAMAPELAEQMVQKLVARLAQTVAVETGQFQAQMEVALVNDGPVTLWLDSRAKEKPREGEMQP